MTLEDVSDGQELIQLPLICGTDDPTSTLGVFQQWIPHAIAHTSFIEEQRPTRVASLFNGDSSDSEDGGFGCSCRSPDATVDPDRACTAQSDCECVAEFGNFYDDRGRLLLDALPARHALVECSTSCGCQPSDPHEVVASKREAKRRRLESQEYKGLSCANHVTARGISVKVELRPTASTGLGVFAVEPIERGTFVCEYAGEIISDGEAAARWEQYGAAGIGNYILCLREWHTEGDSDAIRTNIDATHLGNLGRFLNHMCPPLANLVILPVRGGAIVGNIPADATAAPPRAAVFAARDIQPGQQLGYDYAEAGSPGRQADIGPPIPSQKDREAPPGEQLLGDLRSTLRAETRKSRNDEGLHREGSPASSKALPPRGPPCSLEEPVAHASHPAEARMESAANTESGSLGHKQIGSQAIIGRETTASGGSSQAAESHPDASGFAETHSSGVRPGKAIGHSDARPLGKANKNVKTIETRSKEIDAPILPDLLDSAETRTACRCGSSECRGWLPFSGELR